ncbi:MAG: hypothetical protein SGI92_01545 [Bryobacteraceae bacterium]|nr:hypothetical protein [Bryobacteraceae bacterium]
MDAPRLDHILLWPLQLRNFKQGHVDKWAEWVETQPESAWRKVNPLEDVSEDQRSSVLAYFHPFVRDILLCPRPGQESMEVLRRDDIQTAAVRMYEDSEPVVLRVVRAELYLFEARIAILVLEVETDQKLPLVETERLLDRFRRTYAPYFEGGKAQRCPAEVLWSFANGRTLKSTYETGFRRPTSGNQNIRSVSEHWSDLLFPLIPYPAPGGEPGWNDLADERMTAMTYLAVDNPESLTTGEWIRLTMLDPGEAHTLPYSKRFLANFQAKYCYDRFWDPKTKNHEWMNTRFCCSGYHFLMVGSAVSGFFTDARSGALSHFRTHYFYIGLLVHMQHVPLLMFLEKLLRATRLKDKAEYAESVQQIQREFAHFTSGVWFIELTPQVQGRELYEWWMRRMGTLKLYDEVKAEIALAHDILASQESSKLNKAAGYLLPLNLVLALFGVSGIDSKFHTSDGVYIGAIALACLLALLLGALWLGELKYWIKKGWNWLKRRRG